MTPLEHDLQLLWAEWDDARSEPTPDHAARVWELIRKVQQRRPGDTMDCE